MSEIYRKICQITKNDGNWEFYDCENNYLDNPCEKTLFPSTMNKRYRNFRKKYAVSEDESCVWILKGKAANCEEWIQVGRTKNLANLLSKDIKEDIKEFYSGKGKYGSLKTEYDELVFYEVDIKKFIELDDEAQKILGIEPEDKNLKMIYLVNCAAYIEGKLSFEHNAKLYHPSTLDGYFYEYFKSSREGLV